MTSPLISYLGITYKKNEVVSDVLNWFEDAIDFLNYGNPYQEPRTAIAKSEDIKHLVLNMMKEMDLDIEDFRIEEKDDSLTTKFNSASDPACCLSTDCRRCFTLTSGY